MISIVCIYEERQAYNEKLGQSLILLEDCAYELIVKKRVGNLVDNLTEAIKQSHNDLILVVNEQLQLPSNLMTYLDAYQDHNFGVIGYQGRKHILVSEGVCNVVSPDFYLLHKTDYLDHPFDLHAKQHYLEDFCYGMMQMGKENYVIPVPIHPGNHLSQKDDDIVLCHLGYKYNQKEIDTITDYYPTHTIGRVKKFAKKIKKIFIKV